MRHNSIAHSDMCPLAKLIKIGIRIKVESCYNKKLPTDASITLSNPSRNWFTATFSTTLSYDFARLTHSCRRLIYTHQINVFINSLINCYHCHNNISTILYQYSVMMINIFIYNKNKHQGRSFYDILFRSAEINSTADRYYEWFPDTWTT